MLQIRQKGKSWEYVLAAHDVENYVFQNVKDTFDFSVYDEEKIENLETVEDAVEFWNEFSGVNLEIYDEEIEQE